jgi:Ca-activated chloride channel family protein
MTMPALAIQPPSNGCRLVAADGRALPLRGVEVDADAGGGLARVRLRQTFANPFPEPLRATYQLPLPADGAVVDFAFVIDGQRVVGRVLRKGDAREAFEQAVLEGRTAAILEQERSSLFTQELGNVPPGATVVVEIDVEQPLRWVDGGWEWRWPTVIGPRYLGAPGETPDAPKVTVDVDPGLVVPCVTRLHVTDALTGPASSPSHPLTVGDALTLGGALDRDVVVRWPVAAPQVGARIETARPAGDADAYALVTLVPPKVAAPPVPRDLCLLLDTSGSMGGAPLAQLKAFSRALIAGLRDGDQLEMIEFSNAPDRWKPAPVRVDAKVRAEATRWIDALRAGGGTAMHEAVTEALRPVRPEAQRQVVLVTDGYIGFEAEVVKRVRQGLPRGSRLHVVGIGSSVNRTLTGGGARAGGGAEVIVGPDEPVDVAVVELLARTGDPQEVDLRISGSAVLEHAPLVAPDLMAGAPCRLSLRVRAEGGVVRLETRTAAGREVRELRVGPVGEGTGRRVLATRFARERVEDLEIARAIGESVDPEIEALGLRHAIATRLTSWVAATEEKTVDPSDPTREVAIPQTLPYGVSADGVGLRATSTVAIPPPPPMSLAAPRKPSPVAVLGAAAPPAPARAGRREEKAKKEVDKADATRWGADDVTILPEAEEYQSSVERLTWILKAVIRARPGGRLVIDAVVDADLDWSEVGLEAVGADGVRVAVTALPGSTRSGRVAAGQTLRLVIQWSGADPARIEAGPVTLELA